MLGLGTFLFAIIKLKCRLASQQYCKMRLIDFFKIIFDKVKIIIPYKCNINLSIVSSKCKEEEKYSNLKV